MTSKQDRAKALEEQLEILDAMMVSLVELLESKGVVTQEEWDSRVRTRLAEDAKLKKMHGSLPRE